MRKPKIKITLVDRLGKCGCHRGHKIGDTFDYDTDRGKLCPTAMHLLHPHGYRSPHHKFLSLLQILRRDWMIQLPRNIHGAVSGIM